MFSKSLTLNQADPDLFKVIEAERQRQEQHIELIASENYTSPAVMAAQGSQLTNKYAEGYPGKRFLRRLRVCRPGRADCDRQGKGIVRCGIR